MRRAPITVGLPLLAVLALSTLAYAAKPHFSDATAITTDGLNSAGATSAPQTFHGGLLVDFREAGLGATSGTNYVVSASATATYACVNGGGNNPKASNKVTVSGPVSGGATFSADANGQVTAQIAVPPLGPGDFTCPGGQSLVLASVSYTNVRITDTTNNVFKDIPGTFTLTLVSFN